MLTQIKQTQDDRLGKKAKNVAVGAVDQRKETSWCATCVGVDDLEKRKHGEIVRS